MASRTHHAPVLPTRLVGSQPVPIIGQGTWDLEGDPAGAVVALRRGLDLGLTHIDTAEMYGGGAVETIVGQAIAGHRDDVFLVSKVLPPHASRQGTVAACDRSLARLGTDRLDLYLLHWPGDHPLAETIAAFETLLAAGKILAYGVSNFAVAELAEAHALAGPGRIACNQVLYHVGERAIEHAVLPWCEAHGVAVVAYSPFGQGDFPRPPSAGRRVLDAIAVARGATPYQVALAFLLRHRPVLAIPKAKTPSHVADNAAAAALALLPDEIAQIEASFPRGPATDTVPTL